MGGSPPKLSAIKWVYIAGAAFLMTLAAGIAFIVLADRATIPNAIYFVILFPLGLAAAAFLFGAMRSHAKYSGKISYGTLELGGPVVVFAMVVLGGMLANKAATFSLVVRVHGPGGAADIIREGTLTADLAGDRRTKVIGEEGEVIFANVPNELDGQPIRLIPAVAGFEPSSAAPVVIPENHIVELALQRRSFNTAMRGTVTNSLNQAVKDATLNFNSGAITAVSDQAGNFSVVLPLSPGTVIPLTVTLNGQIVYDDNITVAEQPPLRIRIAGSLP